MMEGNLVDQLRLPNDVVTDMGNTDEVTNRSTVEGDWFIRGPIIGRWINKAASLTGDHTLHVALTILYVQGLQKNNKSILLDRFHFNRLCVMKDSAKRALERLQKAGLIKYTTVGQKYKVTVLSAEGLPRADVE